jgi:predicted DNA-binding transcriptional regulator AlpA
MSRQLVPVLADSSRIPQVPMILVMERQERRDPDAMLTKLELAKALRVSTRTVDRWLAEKSGPPVVRLPHGQLRWRWSDVVAWVEDRRDT